MTNYDLTKISERWRALEDGKQLLCRNWEFPAYIAHDGELRGGSAYEGDKTKLLNPAVISDNSTWSIAIKEQPKPPVTLDEIERQFAEAMRDYRAGVTTIKYPELWIKPPWSDGYKFKINTGHFLREAAYAVARVEAGADGWAVEWGDV